MIRLQSVTEEKARVLRAVSGCLNKIRECVATPPADLVSGLACLDHLSRTVYEDLNQLQHEGLLLRIAESPPATVPEGAVWYWNPRQTGGATEPDLLLRSGDLTLLSIEATVSRSPQGVIGDRLRQTLRKLAEMSGNRYMAVTTTAMAVRARGIVEREQLAIEVLHIPRN